MAGAKQPRQLQLAAVSLQTQKTAVCLISLSALKSIPLPMTLGEPKEMSSLWAPLCRLPYAPIRCLCKQRGWSREGEATFNKPAGREHQSEVQSMQAGTHRKLPAAANLDTIGQSVTFSRLKKPCTTKERKSSGLFQTPKVCPEN